MKKFLIAMTVAILAVTVGVSSAQAKRLGSGGSIGKQSQGISKQSPAQSQSSQATNSANAAKPAAPAAAGAAAKPASPWKGILGGALLGLGLGALLSHFGLSGALASMIGTILMVALLAMAAMFIYRMLRRKQDGGAARPAWAGAAGGAGNAGARDSGTDSFAPQIGSRLEGNRFDQAAQPAGLRASQPFSGGRDSMDNANAPAGGYVSFGVPAGFDTEGFLRHAKTYFIRLQAAWDRADVNDIREFTTPQMFAELKVQIQERGASPNVTDVVSLDAELLGMETEGGQHLASVKFSGLIRDSEQAQSESFAEVWNLSKPEHGQGGWVLAGIQQLS